MVHVRLVFLRSQSISLDDSGIQLSIVNVRRVSPNFCNLSGYLSPPTGLPPIAGSQMLARSIVSLYYSYTTTYIINLNLIIYPSSPGFESESLGPKEATLSLCYTPLTHTHTQLWIPIVSLVTKKNLQKQAVNDRCNG